ncbi:MAG: ACT domain-containing protein [Ardenticatenaceae bacterium]|nr:ACT domain-containing protein [Anaerolineales bacterium]MCB8938710.1 ACT domain-containing protein [Ardenticatenaceae bacterium]MCB8973946.1 ACT domain-containing protein [Ardenticatenaceae bacterium]
MSGETDLSKMLATLAPQLHDTEFVFCTFPLAAYGNHTDLEPIASFIEAEGLTLVIPRHRAEQHGIAYEGAFRCITLSVHSSLAAVGLTAVIATQLAKHHISANVIAAYYHDHVFVQNGRANDALAALNALIS